MQNEYISPSADPITKVLGSASSGTVYHYAGLLWTDVIDEARHGMVINTDDVTENGMNSAGRKKTYDSQSGISGRAGTAIEC